MPPRMLSCIYLKSNTYRQGGSLKRENSFTESTIETEGNPSATTIKKRLNNTEVFETFIYRELKRKIPILFGGDAKDSNGNVIDGIIMESGHGIGKAYVNSKIAAKVKLSNGKDFEAMFNGCPSLLDIKILKNWNVSNKNYLNDLI